MIIIQLFFKDDCGNCLNTKADRMVFQDSELEAIRISKVGCRDEQTYLQAIPLQFELPNNFALIP